MLGAAEEHEESKQQQRETRGQEVTAVGVFCQKRLRRLVHRVICRREEETQRTEKKRQGCESSVSSAAAEVFFLFFSLPPQNITLED